MITQIVFATNNEGKLRELAACFANLALTPIAQAKLGVEDIAETGLTFVENALIKARYACQVTGLSALADDSGLAVAALQGAPGIYSARYAGEKADAAANIQKLLTALKDIPPEARQASFHCVLVYLSHAEDPTPLICQGVWHGSILQAAQGSDGFGYDPIFYVPTENKSAAELTMATKNRISHRGLALRSLLEQLPQKLADSAKTGT